MTTHGGRRPSIRLLVALIVVAPIVAVAAALVVLSTVTARRISEDLAQSLMDSATAGAADRVRIYLSSAVRVSDLYIRRLRTGALPVSGLQAWERPMLEDLATTPDVASICFGNQAGDAAWLLRGPGRLEVGRAYGDRDGAAVEFASDAEGNLAQTPLREYQYDPRQRPWYAAAANANAPVWTPIYFWFGDRGADSATGSGYTRAFRDQTGALAGVLVIDVTLGALSDFLRQLPLAETGHIFIADDQGLLVAASEGKVNTDAGERLSLEGAELPAAQAAAEALSAFRRAESPDDRTLHTVTLKGRPARAEVARLRPYPGIDWRIIAVIPESAFLGEARAVQRRSIWMALIAVAGSVFLGVRLSRQLSGPLLRISEHVRRVGAGDFESRLSLNAARELETLSADLNKMAGDLKQHIELQQSLAVAVEVQRSLLPAADPRPPGLDVAGRSRYCDAAGGDYYDFIDVAPIRGGGTLIAVGDVMGHGISAALLMASARAAVRVQAAESGDLASLMRKVNDALAADARHKQFMTLALMVLAPEHGGVRWASAGHDPAIVYHPRTDEFEELEGGDVPLGIMAGVEYAEYRRAGLEPGDVVFMGTDGIWEMPNGQGAMFGKDRLRAVIRAHADEGAAAIARRLEEALAAFRGEVKPKDDVTFVVSVFTPRHPPDGIRDRFRT